MDASCPAGLYVISAPLGNPEDITLRALRVLKAADYVACEDTRRTGALLSSLGLKKTLTSFHSHTKLTRLERLLSVLESGAVVALMTDCGTPGISDPGSQLVQAAAEAGVGVFPVPGPSALTAALSVSGFAASGVFFAGFFSPKGGKRRRQIREGAENAQVLVCYESPHRIRRLLEDILEVLGDREVALCREMTKTYEEILRGTAGSLLESGFTEKGEFTVLVNLLKSS